MSSCYYKPNIHNDVSELCNLNNSIKPVRGLLISSRSSNNIYCTDKSKILIRYSNNIKAIENDTVYNLGYTKSIYKKQNNSSIFSCLAFTKCFFENDLYHVIELFNQDTLYHYTTLTPLEDSRFFVDYTFKKGKYFFMFERSREYDTFGQKIFFYYNYDSLMDVKENTAPDLPSIDSISMKDFYESKFYKNFKKDKPYLF